MMRAMLRTPLADPAYAAIWLAVGVLALGPARQVARAERQAVAGHLRAERSRLVRSDGQVFQWRGITAFRLLERLAAGRDEEVRRYLDWAAGEGLSVVRVLTMAHALFALAPEQGLATLPRLLDLADERGLYVEVVALADTAEIDVGLASHVSAVGALCARHPNALLELANEPAHPSQRGVLADPTTLAGLRQLVPAAVPVAVGPSDDLKLLAVGDYATFHVARGAGDDPWDHVAALVAFYDRLDPLDMPLVNDEPIGAGPVAVAGRRDNDPSRFRALAVLSRFLGIGATFHYEDGLQARIPSGLQADCLAAWLDAWRVLPDDIERRARFMGPPGPDSPLVDLQNRELASVYEIHDGASRWFVAIGVPDGVQPVWRSGWRVSVEHRWSGLWLARAMPAGASGDSAISPSPVAVIWPLVPNAQCCYDGQRE